MTINVNNSTIITEAIGNRTHHSCKPVINRTTGEVYASATDAAEQLGATIDAVSMCCRGKLKSCKGNRLEYLNKTSGNVDSLTKEIQKLRAKIESMEEDAAVGRAIREAEEAKQKAEEKRLAEIDNAKLAVIKAREKVERRDRMVERRKADWVAAVERHNEAARELAEKERKLFDLEGR